MRVFFGCGNNNPRNRYELLAGLAGHIKDNVFLIEAVIPGNLENCNENEAAFFKKNYDELISELKIINVCRALLDEKYRLIDEDYRLIGIAHTHPNGLKSVMSLPDMCLHKQMLDVHTEFISVILNPQRKTICAYFNSIYNPIDIEILTDNPEKWGMT